MEFDVPLSSWLSIYPELSCDYIIKQDTIIPGARNVYYFSFGAGLDFTFNIAEKSSVYVGLSGGEMIHINNSKASFSPYFGLRVGYDYPLSSHFSLGVISRATLSIFPGRSENLMDSMTLIFAPIGVTLTYKL